MRIYEEQIKTIAEFYGYDSQSRQCIEEMAELTQAINKMWRKSFMCGFITLDDIQREESENPHIKRFSNEKEYKSLIEELADVQIMLWQMQYLLKADISTIIEQKLDRQMERIKKEGDANGTT